MNSDRSNNRPSRVYHGRINNNVNNNNSINTPKVKYPDPLRPQKTENVTNTEVKRKPNKRFSMPRNRPQIGSASATKPGIIHNIPEVKHDHFRIIPLGGVEEIGMNMTVFENEHDIIIIDGGFKFKDEGTPGVDYILPNTKYLEERKDKIRGMIVTHGHLDHIGALPYILPKIGMPAIYTRNLTSMMIKKRQSEFPHVPAVDFKVVEGNETITMGQTKVSFYGVTHSIPDSLGINIHTPYGYITTPGDFKLDHIDGVPTQEEEDNYKIFDGKNVLMLLGESTNIENPGFSTPERLVHENLSDIIKNMNGRLILGMFASHFYRITSVVQACEKYGKKLVVEGLGMKNNIAILIQAGFLKVDKSVVITAQDMNKYSPDKIVILATGAQGDTFAALMRMASKQHKYIQLGEKDTVLLSSSIIPGNEKAIQKMKDSIARLGSRIIHYRTSDVYIHSTGHANRGEIEWLHRKLRPKFFMPLHGNHYHLKLHAELANQLGIPKENIIVPDDCSILEIQDNGNKLAKLDVKAPDNVVVVDGFAIGDVQDVVLRDRQILAEDGIFVVVSIVDSRSGRLIKSPDIISRGSVYLRESGELLRQIRTSTRATIEKGMHMERIPNMDLIKDVTADTLGKLIFQETSKRPIVIPVITII